MFVVASCFVFVVPIRHYRRRTVARSAGETALDATRCHSIGLCFFGERPARALNVDCQCLFCNAVQTQHMTHFFASAIARALFDCCVLRRYSNDDDNGTNTADRFAVRLRFQRWSNRPNPFLDALGGPKYAGKGRQLIYNLPPSRVETNGKFWSNFAAKRRGFIRRRCRQCVLLALLFPPVQKSSKSVEVSKGAP